MLFCLPWSLELKTIVYIAGDGRSGSTLVELILANDSNTIAIGEGYRFWKRYEEGSSECGCGTLITSCELWKKVNARLHRIEEYSLSGHWAQIQYLLQFKNWRKIQDYLKTPEYSVFSQVVRDFYNSVFQYSGKSVILDSSKNIGWLHVLKALGIAEIKILHLERNPCEVMNSWKKKVKLPEYQKEVWMPRKSNITILKSLLKIKLGIRYFKNYSNYWFVSFEWVKTETPQFLEAVKEKFGLKIDSENLNRVFNHGIGGNPIRFLPRETIVIQNKPNSLEQLSTFDKICCKLFIWYTNLFFDSSHKE